MVYRSLHGFKQHNIITQRHLKDIVHVVYHVKECMLHATAFIKLQFDMCIKSFDFKNVNNRKKPSAAVSYRVHTLIQCHFASRSIVYNIVSTFYACNSKIWEKVITNRGNFMHPLIWCRSEILRIL